MRLKTFLFSVSFSLSALLVSAHGADEDIPAGPSNVLELTSDNFDVHIGKGIPALVEFFAPWCGHCKNLAPIYEEVASVFAHAKDKIVIAKVDADGAGRALGQKYEIKGYPTLKWFSADGKEEPYEGGRELEDFVSYIEQKASVKSKIPPPPPSDVQILDLHNIEEVVEKSGKHVLVAFTAPWCGHCKHLKPIYEKVATTFKPEKNCIVANLNADDQKNSAISQKYGIQGFPTLKFFAKGNLEDYEGARTEEALVNYLNEKCGTKRKVGGGLNEEAGRLSHLDDFAHQFYIAPDTTGQKVVYGVFKSLDVDDLEKEGEKKRYLNVMEKILKDKDGLGYVEREKGRLTKILSKRTLAIEKSDEMQKKVNVLSAFSAVKPGEGNQEKEGQGKEVKEERRDQAEL